MPHHYLVSGIRVMSDHPVSAHMAHGWQHFESSTTRVDVTIRVLEISDFSDPRTNDSKSEVLFQPRTDLLFKISQGSQISIYRDSGIDDRDITIFLIGSAWGVLCHQRGLLPLHCSAVADGTKAFAFIAPSGGGKSTIAASLCQLEYDHVCDDVAVVDISITADVSLRAMPKGLKLWREAVEALGLEPKELVTSDERMEKYYVDLPKGSDDHSLGLTAIYTLQFDDDISEPEIVRIRGSELLKNLYANIYRIEWIDKIGDPARVLAQVRALAESVPVYRFSRPRALDDLKSSTEFISDHFSSIEQIAEKREV